MSLRAESLKAYRQLYRAASITAAQCSLYNQDGLQRYVSHRFHQEAEQNRRRIGIALQEVTSRGSKELQATSTKATKTRQVERAVAKQTKKLLRQYEQHVSQQIDHVRATVAMLPDAASDAALVSLLQVLAAGVGNTAYQRTMEINFANFFVLEEKKAVRDEATEEATSERQNRIMQQAILPYGERLLLAHRTAIGEGNRESPLSYLSPWQVTEAIVGTRSGVTAHHVRLGRDHVVVEVDETYNKQVVYVCCTRGEGVDSGSYDWEQEIERVDVAESEEVRRTMFHSEYLLMATRLCDALVHETPLHPTRKTVLVGHAVGGAVAVVLAMLLSQRGFEVSNTFTFGAPKSMQRTLDRYAATINPVRVVLAGDPLVELPVSGTEGELFAHVGEILLITVRSGSGSVQGEDEGGETAGGGVSSSASLRETVRQRVRAERGDIVDDDGENRDAGSSSPAAEMSADDLAAALNDEDDTLSSSLVDDLDNVAAGKEEPSEHEEFRRNEVRPQQDQHQAEEEEEEDEEGIDLRGLCRIAAQRYKRHFLAEDYIRALADPTAELTYAEGDDVWDEGEYASSVRRNGGAEPLVSSGERRQRNLNGAV